MKELTLDQALMKGVEAHKAGKLQEADRYYTAILKARPTHPDANHNMGVLAIGLGKVQEALPFFKNALEANSSITQFWLSYIDALIKLNRMNEAKAVLDEAKSKSIKGDGFEKLKKRVGLHSESKNDSKDSEESKVNILDRLNLYQALKLAKKNLKDGLSMEAKGIYKDILKRFPKNKKAVDGIKALSKKVISKSSVIKDPPQNQLQNLINLYTQGQFQKVLAQGSQLLKDFPKSVNLYNIVGATNKGLGNLEEAIKAYNKALSLKPDYAEVYNNMGIAIKDQGKLDEAIEAYNKALSLKPDYAEAYNNMGIALQDQGKLEEAIEAYNKSLSHKPDYAEAYNNIGIALQDQGKLEEAIKAYIKTLSLKPDYIEAHNNMGNALRDQGKTDKAIEAYDKALSLKPDFSEAYNNMGVALRDHGKLKKAIEAYNKAISIKPDYSKAYNNMGIALQDQGKLEEAIEVYNKAISIKADYAEAFNNMGVALKNLGKIDEAIEVYTKALSIKPDNETAKHMLSALTGTANETAPREYVENLFDGYARKFETSLVDKLEYKIPKLIGDILIKSNDNKELGSVLDLGCGTGLFGTEIKNYCSKLEGIDLSNKMLAIANQKNVYYKLTQTDIVEYLSTMPLDFDYYVALDVFIYVGKLNEIFRLIKSRNKKPGYLVFSTEHAEKDGYHLRKTGRYSHSKSYIEILCKKFDYSISHFSTTELRKEKGDFLRGGIYVLSFKT